LKSAVEDELDRRESLRSKPPMKIDPQIADSIIRAGVRAMSKSHHPDLGSSHEFMTKINVTADLLREMVLGCE
jgi:hypothetical protein